MGWNNQSVWLMFLKTDKNLTDLKRENSSSSLNLNLMIHSSGSKYVIMVSDESRKKKKAKCTSENEKRYLWHLIPTKALSS